MRKRPCIFCAEKSKPSYKEVVMLKRFITERGKIIPRLKTGVCSTHQRQLSREIKRARQLALLQFAPQI